jgi:hypothetical protein
MPESLHLCGYVGLPVGHSLYGKDYNDVISVKPETTDRKINVSKVGVINLLCGVSQEQLSNNTIPICLAFDVHGGMTFAKVGLSTSNDGLWYFGFDAAHCDDICPGYDKLMRFDENQVYRTFEYMKNETNNLARQIYEYESSKEH